MDDVARTEDEKALREVEKQVLWLATSIVQAANARPGDGSGHPWEYGERHGNPVRGRLPHGTLPPWW